MDVDAALQSQIRNIETTYGNPSTNGSRSSTRRGGPSTPGRGDAQS